MTQTLHRSDAELKHAVTEELAWTAGVNSTHIGVAVRDGAITLSGEVESYPEKMLAEHAVLHVRGVTAFAEEITVRNTWVGVTDADIAREVTEALERSVVVPPESVTATVHDHVITLLGTVQWQYEREAAARSVRYLKGVVNVHNAITIRPTVSADDIKAMITAALVRSARLEGSHTTVTADAEGVVTLAGTVRSWAERRAAEHAAWSAPGVTDVVNHLGIQH